MSVMMDDASRGDKYHVKRLVTNVASIGENGGIPYDAIVWGARNAVRVNLDVLAAFSGFEELVLELSSTAFYKAGGRRHGRRADRAERLLNWSTSSDILQEAQNLVHLSLRFRGIPRARTTCFNSFQIVHSQS